MSSFVQKSSVKITKDYSYTIKGDPSAPIGAIGGASREDRTFSFKVGQVYEGYIQDSGTNIRVQLGNYQVTIPKSNWELNDELGKKPSNLNLADYVQETDIDRRVEKNETPSEPFLQKHKNYLLIAVALVAGYFAYKKFKK